MSRRKIVKEELEERIEEAQVVMRWSAKRIVVATFVVIIIIGGGLYVISLISQNKSVLGERTLDEPQIKLPTERSVEKILEQAQDDLSNINAKDIIGSQPKIQKIINDLNSLTTSSMSAKDLICDAVCK